MSWGRTHPSAALPAPTLLLSRIHNASSSFVRLDAGARASVRTAMDTNRRHASRKNCGVSPHEANVRCWPRHHCSPFLLLLLLLTSFLFLTFLLSLVTVSGQSGAINSWTKPSSGFWEEPYWSLGVLPNSSQSVLITNQNWKAVAITPSTASNFPDSVTVGSLP